MAATTVLLAAGLLGCDLVQGFKDAGEAMFPTELTYLDTPGVRLVAGNYRGLELAAGRELLMLVRSSNQEDHALYSMRYADPKPCAIPNVGDHQGGGGVYQGPTVIGYLEPEVRQGTMHFVDGSCTTLALTIPNATLPMAELAKGFVLFAGSNLVFADPAANVLATVAEKPTGLWWDGLSSMHLVLVGGRLGAFRVDWTEAGWFGKGVNRDRASRVGADFFFEDETGIHRLSRDGDGVADTVVSAGGCQLAFPGAMEASDAWISFVTKCDGSENPPRSVYSVSNRTTSEFPFDVDPNQLRIIPQSASGGGDPATDPFFYLYREDVDDNDLGTLRLRLPDGTVNTLGTGAALDRVLAFRTDGTLRGFALVDIVDGVGRWVRWDQDGTVSTVAEGVLRGTRDLLVNFDGDTGDLAIPTASGVAIVAHHVPPDGFQLRDPHGRWTVLKHEASQGAATLSFTNGTFSYSDLSRTPGPLPEFQVLAPRALQLDRTQFLTKLPAVAYFDTFDDVTGTGRLVYRNLELEFTGTVHDGLADFLSTNDGLIYTIPFGPDAGIWLARSR